MNCLKIRRNAPCDLKYIRRLLELTIIAFSLAGGVVLAGAAASTSRLPNQGGFRNGQAMWDWLGGAGEIWWDGGSPLYSVNNVRDFVSGRNSDAMRCPRPGKVKLYMQGHVPRLPHYTYAQAAANDKKFRQEWREIARVCVEAGYTDCIFGSSETQMKHKPWMPTAEEVRSGQWRQAWINMVEAVRSVMPEAKFAFVPMSGGQSRSGSNPSNGILEKDLWYVDGKDSRGKPYMDFWGTTLYFGLHGVRGSADKGVVVTPGLIDQAMNVMRKPSADPHQDWGYMGQYQYAKEKGLKLVIGECGIFDRFPKYRPFGMGDQPHAIDLLTKLLADHADQIELVCWFNMTNKGKNSNMDWSRLDAQSTMPKAAKRLQELWGPGSPYRHKSSSVAAR